MDKADVGKYSYYIFNQRISGLFAPFSGTLQADRIRTVLPDAMIKKGPAHHKKRPPDRMVRESLVICPITTSVGTGTMGHYDVTLKLFDYT